MTNRALAIAIAVLASISAGRAHGAADEVMVDDGTGQPESRSSAKIEDGKRAQFFAETEPTDGESVEIGFDSGGNAGTITSFDRGVANTYRDLRYEAGAHNWFSAADQVMSVSSTGFNLYPKLSGVSLNAFSVSATAMNFKANVSGSAVNVLTVDADDFLFKPNVGGSAVNVLAVDKGNFRFKPEVSGTATEMLAVASDSFKYNTTARDANFSLYGSYSTTYPAVLLDTQTAQGKPVLLLGDNEDVSASNHRGVDFWVQNGTMLIDNKGNTSAYAPELRFWRSRVGSGGSGVAVCQSGDIMGSINSSGLDGRGGSNTSEGAWIRFVVDGTITSMVEEAPQKIEFYTADDVPSGTSTPDLRMVIRSYGSVGIGTDTPGAAYKLDVNGNARFGGIDVSGNIDGVDLSAFYAAPVSITGENYVSVSGRTITASEVSLTANVTGTLPFANGGTGSTSFSSAAIPFSNGTILTQDASNFVFDNANDRLGIGTSSPGTALDLTVGASGGIDIDAATAGGALNANPRIALQLEGTTAFALGVDDNDNDDFKIGTTAIGTNTRFRITGGAGSSAGAFGFGVGAAAPAPNFAGIAHAAGSVDNFLQFTNTDTGATSSDGLILGVASDEGTGMVNFESTDMSFSTAGNALRLVAGAAGMLEVTGDGGVLLTAATATDAAAGIGFNNTGVEPTAMVGAFYLFGTDEEGGEGNIWENATGTSTRLTSHKAPPGGFRADDEMPHSLHSMNRYIGKSVTVDVTGALRDLGAMMGKTYVHVEQLSANEMRDWDADQQALKVKVDAERLKKAMSEEIEIALEDAREQVAEIAQVPREAQEPIYVFDPAAGELVESTETVTVYDSIPTGEIVWQLKEGVRLDRKSGKFFRKRTEAEAAEVMEPYVPRDPAAWAAARMAN